jgi:hypothetical protein
MLFTEEQIAFIDQMISRRLMESRLSAKSATLSSFHSVPEIRLLISSNIEKLRNDINAKEFDLNILRFFLKKYTTLRPQDEEYIDGAGCTRFDNQVSNAIRPDGWPNGACPIRPSGKMRKYQFVDFASQSALDLQ